MQIRTRHFGLVLLMSVISVAPTPAQTFANLLSFGGSNGANPGASLIQGTDGNLYGTTGAGGANGNGTIFKITTSGQLTTLDSFCAETNCAGGPGMLIQATNGNFYGTTGAGGTGSCIDVQGVVVGCGTIFRLTAAGKLTTIHNFVGTDGNEPFRPLVEAANGVFYGVTYGGGTGSCFDPLPGCGTVFKITASGVLTTMHNFTGTEGVNPYAGLVYATNGELYGTTVNGGVNNMFGGTVFKISPTGTFTTIYSFCAQANCVDGAGPNALLQATNGSLYGTAFSGGANNKGTVFRITPGGSLKTLASFAGSNGELPEGLTEGTDGALYGTTDLGGANGYGAVFKAALNGTLTVLHSLAEADGTYPMAGLLQSTNGTFYGTTNTGGTGEGTIFSISVGLAPFVVAEPTSGKTGAVIKILGTNLSGTTAVSFNGTAAGFNVFSASEIEAFVPSGATTGKIQVTTPGGTLLSNVPFRVR